MRNRKILAAGVLIMSCLLVACSTAAGTSTKEKYEPAVVEKTDTGAFVTLDQKAAERLGIETTAVADADVVREGSSGTKVVPYGAVLYNVDGNAFVYTNPEGLKFVRAAITIAYIEEDLAVLSDGPASGTMVVTVGAAELFGAEFGVK